MRVAKRLQLFLYASLARGQFSKGPRNLILALSNIGNELQGLIEGSEGFLDQPYDDRSWLQQSAPDLRVLLCQHQAE